ncbi:MAG: transposase [Patescibacteria group bacterium]
MSELLFYHTYNRGVDKRKIFLDDLDYFRGVHDLYEFNDVKAVTNFDRRSVGFTKPNILSNIFEDRVREKLIDIGVWCLMPNHYHLFSSLIIDGGLIKFHKKFGGGFANFFNTKYKRSGALFQGRYKKVRVVDDVQALQLICYIHSNPLDLWKPNWKENGLNNLEIQNALNFLEKEYRWSSHLDWWGIKNFPSPIDNDFMRRFFKSSEEYREFFTNWLRYYEKNTQSIQKLILE